MASASPISSDRWRQIEDIFHAASQRDPDRRAAFLEEACGSDSDLRREVETLLATLDTDQPDLELAVHDAADAYIDAQSKSDIKQRITEGVCLDHYRVLKTLGSGGMGEVYLAEDIQLKRKVAIKMLPFHLTRNATAMGRLEQEARLLSGLNHANLLTVHEFCHAEGRHFLVTEFVEGETVRHMLDRAPINWEEAVKIAVQAATALVAAHASGVIHRDIKPENIMVRADGCVKILDFGIAKFAERPLRTADGETMTTIASTATGHVLGTPRYMSPEQARGVKVDERTDIFSLGAVLYEMLTGEAAFTGETHSDLIAAILRNDPPPMTQYVRDIPRRLQAIVTRSLAKNRSQRYQAAESLVADLEEFRHEAERRRERRTIWLVTALVVVALVLAGIVVSRQVLRQSGSPAPRSLAVLPFRNLHPDPATDFLGVSLADEVIAKLGYVKALTVRPSSSVNRFRNSSVDLRAAARDLKADMLVTGTYLKDGDQLRITARLIGFNPDAVLWQDTQTVEYDKLLTVQDRVAKMVIQGLSLRLAPDEERRLKPDKPVNSLAYEYYLRGVDLYSTSNFGAAITMLEKSVTMDPNYAPTWAYLGRTYTTNASLQFGGRRDYESAEQAYDKAIALNPIFPEPRIYMANLLTDTGRVEEAVPLMRVALQSSPNNAEAHWELGYAYRYGGMLKQSEAECELARKLDPEVKINSSALNTYLYLFEYDKFLNSLPANDSPLMIFYHGFGSYYKHDYSTAETDFDRAYELAPELLPAQIGKALSYAIRHEPSLGLASLRETEKRIDERGVRDAEALYKVAQAYAILGDRDSALRILRRSIAGGFFCYTYIERDPLLSSLRGSSDFSRVLNQARQRAEQFSGRFSQSA